MNRLSKMPLFVMFAALLAVTIAGCKKKNETPKTAEPGQYSALVCVGSWPNTAYYIANVPSLKEGIVSIKGNGAELTGKVYAQDVIQRNGFYYHANAGSGKLGKYHVDNGALVVDKEVVFNWLNWSTYTWVDNETLVIFGTGGDPVELRYAIIKVSTMAITTGKISAEAIPAGFQNYSVGFAQYRDSKLFVSYGFASTDWTQYPNMPVFKKFNVAVLTYPAMTLDKTISDTRTTGVGGSEVYAKSSFIDENNDLYFLSDPVNTYDYLSPSAIYRIKSGSTDLDPTYFFNFSATVGNEMGAAMWYIGGGKAIIRTRVAGQSIDKDHSFSVINVKTGAFIKKLDLPADKGERMVQAVLVEDAKVYIAVNAVDRDYIWEYDPATDKLTKGVEFVGGIDYILRIEKTK